MRTMTAEKAAAEIRRAYTTHTGSTDGQYASIAGLMERMDLTVAEFTAGALHLLNTDDRFDVVPESNQRMLTAAQHACAIRVGNKDNHAVIWD